MDDQNKVFISYRRSVSQDRARLIFRELRERGYDVFLDVTTIDSGAFDRIILNQIAARPHFLLILSPGSLERCVNEGDWLRREIEEAFRLKRNIVPVFDEAFDVGKEKQYLPEPMRSELPRLNAPPYNHYYFDAFIETLCTRFLKSPVYDIPIAATPPVEQAEVQRRMEQVEQSVDSDMGVNRINASAKAVRAVIGDPFEWCEVPAGKFLYGETKEKLTLPTFAIAKYPITYSQFQAFIDAQDGFRDSRWWQELSRRSDKPGEQKWKIPDHPRENVGWHDAIAFCRWLSCRFGDVDDLDKVASWVVRLPSEFEWEKAARGTDGREYPWGGTFDKLKANTIASNLQQTTPVTDYPQGESPYGVLDMIGNTWEWCLTDFMEPILDISQENLSSYSTRVLRGGSLFVDPDLIRVSYRGNYRPYARDDSVGFRIACTVQSR